MDRKCLPLFVVFVMIFTLSGCGPAEEPVNTAEEQEPASTAEEPVSATEEPVSATEEVGEGVTIPDEALERVIRVAIQKHQGPIYVSELETITSLRESGRGYARVKITDLAGLEYLSNLTELVFHYGGISDLSPLASLANFTSLSLYDNRISDISPLASLTNLTNLGLRAGANINPCR